MTGLTAPGRDRILLAVIVAVGLALRVGGAQGALWLDEAWSAKLAQDAATPIGVFLNINHDNNHHINSVWLQFVGAGAHPIFARSLSIVTGTLAIVAAAWVAAPRGRLAMLATAWLFAISPILVTLGSEARGYAPMSLALLVAVGTVERMLAEPRHPGRTTLALCFFLGALSQLTMVFGVCALVGWYAFATWHRAGFGEAVRRSARAFTGPLLALIAAIALVFVPAAMSPTGFQFGRYDPFDGMQYLHGVVEMIGYTVAWPVETGWLIAGAAVLVVLARPAGVSKLAFYRLAIIGFPLMLAILQSGNVAHPRYYLVAGIALLLIGEMAAAAYRAGGWRRGIAIIGMLGVSAPALALDIELIRNQRGDAGGVVRAMQARAPAGSVMILDRDTGYAMVEQSALAQGYRVVIQETGCPPQRFLLIDRFRGEHFPRRVLRCGARYEPVASRRATGLSGTHWTLYERLP